MAGPPRLDEQRFIERVARLAAAARPRGAVRPVLGIGDDAAVLAAPPGLEILLTTDFLVEGTHFRTAWTPGFLLGRKAIAVNLSDIAAMGGVPHACVLSVGFPRRTPPAYAEAVARGVADGARRSGVALVGGDTCASPVLFVSLTLLGVVEPGGRCGAARPARGTGCT